MGRYWGSTEEEDFLIKVVSDKKGKSIYTSLIGLILLFVGISILFYPRLTNIYWHMLYNPSQLISLSQNPSGSSPSTSSVSGEIRLEIPQLNLTTEVGEGTTAEILKFLPGRYLESTWPGQGNIAIAGHRTLYGGQFRDIDKLEPGDHINLAYQGSTFIYQVEEVFQVASNDWSILAENPTPTLTLTTCFKLGRDKRLVVKAFLLSPTH